jgi:hypothetical protein
MEMKALGTLKRHTNSSSIQSRKTPGKLTYKKQAFKEHIIDKEVHFNTNPNSGSDTNNIILYINLRQTYNNKSLKTMKFLMRHEESALFCLFGPIIFLQSHSTIFNIND